MICYNINFGNKASSKPQMFANLHLTPRRQVLVTTVACLLLLGAEGNLQLHQFDDDCRDHICIACNVSSEAVSGEPLLLVHDKPIHISSTASVTTPYSRGHASRFIRAPPIT